jgi:hypothetical protein
MRAVEWGAETVAFECPACGGRYLASRCLATVAGGLRRGERCRGAARIGALTCRSHRRIELVGLIASPAEAGR